jgi:hypothetical protein
MFPGEPQMLPFDADPGQPMNAVPFLQGPILVDPRTGQEMQFDAPPLFQGNDFGQPDFGADFGDTNPLTNLLMQASLTPQQPLFSAPPSPFDQDGGLLESLASALAQQQQSPQPSSQGGFAPYTPEQLAAAQAQQFQQFQQQQAPAQEPAELDPQVFGAIQAATAGNDNAVLSVLAQLANDIDQPRRRRDELFAQSQYEDPAEWFRRRLYGG